MLKWGQMLDFVWWRRKKNSHQRNERVFDNRRDNPLTPSSNRVHQSRPFPRTNFPFYKMWTNTDLQLFLCEEIQNYFVRKYKLVLWGNTNLFRKEIRTYVLRMRKLFRKEIQIMPWGNANFSNFISTQRDREEGFDISAYMTLSTAHWYSEYSPILRPFPNISNDISNLSHFAFRFCSNFARIFCLFKLGIDC